MINLMKIYIFAQHIPVCQTIQSVQIIINALGMSTFVMINMIAVILLMNYAMQIVLEPCIYHLLERDQ